MYKVIFSALLVIATLSPCVAAADQTSNDLKSIVDRANDIRANAHGIAGDAAAPRRPDPTNVKRDDDLNSIARRGQEIQRDTFAAPDYDPLAKGTPPGPPPISGAMSMVDKSDPSKAVRGSDQVTYVFLSSSLGEQAINEALELASGRQDVLVLFRGMEPGERFPDAVKRIQHMAIKFDPVPNIQMDPTLFEEYRVSSVPEMVMTRGDKIVARVRGSFAPAFLAERVAGGAAGNLGDVGPVREITEPNLIDVLKEKVATIDWDQKKQEAVERFWARVDMHTLPVAAAKRDRLIDPTVTLTADLKDAKGRVLLPAGYSVNPMKLRPFKLRLIIFNATDQRQVRTAARLAKQGRPGQQVMLIASEVDRTGSWDGFVALENAFDAPVYLLQPDIRSRFVIEHVPSVVESDGDMIRVSEVPPDAEPTNER